MESATAIPRHEAIDHDDLLVHEWRVTQLTRLGSRGTAVSGMIVRPPFPPVPLGLVQGGDAR